MLMMMQNALVETAWPRAGGVTILCGNRREAEPVRRESGGHHRWWRRIEREVISKRTRRR
jgi:hypothetical protein